jgi:hypothetical protein
VLHVCLLQESDDALEVDQLRGVRKGIARVPERQVAYEEVGAVQPSPDCELGHRETKLPRGLGFDPRLRRRSGAGGVEPHGVRIDRRRRARIRLQPPE